MKFFITRLLLLSGIVGQLAQAEPFTTEQLVQLAQTQVSGLSTQQLQAAIADNPDTAIIDVRSHDEILLGGGQIEAPRIYAIPRGELELRIGELLLPADHPIIVYSNLGQRSALAAVSLKQIGYSNVRHYKDGFSAWLQAGLEVELLDKALNSALYSLPTEVAPGVWSAIGATEPPSYDNDGHNNNLSFIVTDEGVVVINAGDNNGLARALHDEIKKVTDQPVKMVVLENGQGHAAGGSAYWHDLGVPIIAHEDAAEEWHELGDGIMKTIQNRMRDKAVGTRFVMPDETFSDEKIIELGGLRIELLHMGPTHSPGDIVVWLPQKKVTIAGDMAFHQRMLPIFEKNDTLGWLETWELFENLKAEVVVPGHGTATNMAEVRKYTRDYLIYMREQITLLLDEGGSLEDVGNIDQSAYRHLDTYDELHRLNASRMFRTMEFE